MRKLKIARILLAGVTEKTKLVTTSQKLVKRMSHRKVLQAGAGNVATQAT